MVRSVGPRIWSLGSNPNSFTNYSWLLTSYFACHYPCSVTWTMRIMITIIIITATTTATAADFIRVVGRIEWDQTLVRYKVSTQWIFTVNIYIFLKFGIMRRFEMSHQAWNRWAEFEGDLVTATEVPDLN